MSKSKILSINIHVLPVNPTHDVENKFVKPPTDLLNWFMQPPLQDLQPLHEASFIPEKENRPLSHRQSCLFPSTRPTNFIFSTHSFRCLLALHHTLNKNQSFDLNQTIAFKQASIHSFHHQHLFYILTLQKRENSPERPHLYNQFNH